MNPTPPIQVDPERMLRIVGFLEHGDREAYERELYAYRRELAPAIRARRRAIRAHADRRARISNDHSQRRG